MCPQGACVRNMVFYVMIQEVVDPLRGEPNARNRLFEALSINEIKIEFKIKVFCGILVRFCEKVVMKPRLDLR